MIAAFRRLAARSRLTKARHALASARAEHRAACTSCDTRRIHAATAALQSANRAVLAAEREALPAAQPLPRPTMRRA